MIYLGLDYAPPLEAHHSVIAMSPDDVNHYYWNHVETGRLPNDSMG